MHRHPSDIEADLKGIAVYVKRNPHMASYIRPKRDRLRAELREAMKASYVAPAPRPSLFRRLVALFQPRKTA